MKSRFRHNILLGLMLVAALVSLVPTAVFASGPSTYLTPASGTVKIGDSFTVSVDGQLGAFWWGGGPNNANGTIGFPANLLKVTSYDDKTNATFPNSTTTVDNSAGTITFNQSTAPWTYTNANSQAHFLTITFQALTSGTAGVQFSSMSYSTGNPTTTGGTYTISAPPAPKPSPSPTPTPTPTPSKPKPSPSPTPTPTPTPSTEPTPAPTSESDGGLKVDNVKITTTRSENSIAWSLNSTTVSQTLSYGTAADKLSDAGTITTLDDGTYKLLFKSLQSGTLYYFTIKATTSDGLQGATYNGTLTTRGYPVVLTIQQGGLSLPGAKVTIANRAFVADTNGHVTTELSDGSLNATVTPPGDGSSQSVAFVVKKLTIPITGDPSTQNFTLDIPAVVTTSAKTTSLLPAIIGGGAVSLAVIGGGIGFLFVRRRRAANEQPLVDVDTSQLAETYGERIAQPMNNTPVPNLEADYAAMAPDSAAVSNAVPMPQPEIPAGEPPINPESMPLPPSPDQATVVAEAPQTDPAGEPPLPIDNELYSQEMNQVEASEQPSNDEPSAIYDASTGELEIIHHHDHHETAAEPMPQPVPVEVAPPVSTQPIALPPVAPQPLPQQGPAV